MSLSGAHHMIPFEFRISDNVYTNTYWYYRHLANRCNLLEGFIEDYERERELAFKAIDDNQVKALLGKQRFEAKWNSDTKFVLGDQQSLFS